MKTYILLYFGPIAAKNLAHRGQISHTPESIHNVPVNHFSWSHIKNLLRKWSKTSKIPIFAYSIPLKKIEAKNKNCTSTTFWIILLCIFKPYIGKIA